MILARSLAETFLFYLKSQTFHWNVTGAEFPQYHRLFGDIYLDAFSAVDALAEHIRAAGEMAPSSMDELCRPGSIKFSPAASAGEMISALAAANSVVLSALRADLKATTDLGIENFLEARIDTHAKWGWMLSATGTGAKPEAKPEPKPQPKPERSFLTAATV